MDETNTGADADGWHPLHPASRMPRVAGAALSFALVAAPLGFFAFGSARSALIGSGLQLAVVIAAATIGAVAGHARWSRTRWKLDHSGFYVRRGWLWRSEILIPRSRVQHLDLERGPLERQLGLASVVIHTAGAHTPALRQSGLADAEAAALRDALIPAPGGHDDAL